MKKNVGIGFLGSTLDNPRDSKNRWVHWRPTIAACWQEEMPLDRYEILYQMKSKPLLDLIVEDIKKISPKTEIVLHLMELEDPWDFEEVFAKLHDFCETQNFRPDKEDYYINITTGTHVVQICLFLLAESKYLPGRLYQLGINSSARDPKGFYKIIDLDLKRYDPLAARFIKEKNESTQLLKAGINTKNEKFNQLIDRIETIASRSVDPILLMGRTGVGKTELARRIFQLKQLKHKIKGSFVEINCATLRGDSVMSTLFGHVKGSFTGAVKDRLGLLKEADGGLIFLDEIGELGLDEQAMLLRAIEDKTFLPVGTDRPVKSHFQLIAGTHRDLNLEVANGRFREDLFARINLWSFHLPDLKNRREDIEPNMEFELAKFSRKTGKKIRFTQESLNRFIKFATSSEAEWKQNFRDLNAAVSRMGTLADSGKIDTDLVLEEIARLKRGWNVDAVTDQNLTKKLLGDKMDEMDLFDLHQLDFVLQICSTSSNLSEAGRKLFAVSRAKKSSSNDSDRLKKYLERFGLVAKDFFSKSKD